MIKVPVLPPNGPGGSFLVGSETEGFTSYPENYQTHAYITGRIVAIVPAPIDSQGNQIVGCDIFMENKVSPIRTTLSAREFIDKFDNLEV